MKTLVRRFVSRPRVPNEQEDRDWARLRELAAMRDGWEALARLSEDEDTIPLAPWSETVLEGGQYVTRRRVRHA